MNRASALAVMALGIACPAFALASPSHSPSLRSRASAPSAPAVHHDAKGATGLYVRGVTAGHGELKHLLDRMVSHGMSTVVLDAKDYDGWLTYPSHVHLAVQAGAVKQPPIADLAETLRTIHGRGLRVAMRIACFEDEVVAKAVPRLSVQSKAGRPYPIGWLDPANEEAQGYVLDLVRESLDAGADEIQLDYVRYPVLGIKNADFHLDGTGRTKPVVIRDFVRKAHALTQARGVPLSLDIFGVVAFGKRSDIENLGQSPAMLARECEALSPMVYPSHYAPGFAGFDEPGAHAELAGMATKAIRDQLEEDHVEGGAVIRPWLQATAWESPTAPAGFVGREIKTARDAGADGWLMWSAHQDYSDVWAAVPRPVASAHDGDHGSAATDAHGEPHAVAAKPAPHHHGSRGVAPPPARLLKRVRSAR